MIPAHAGPTVRTIASGLLIAVAVMASMLALTSVILPGSWTRTGLVGIVLVTCSTTVSRILLESRSRPRRSSRREPGSALPTLVGAVVAAWFLLARYGGPTSDLTVLVGPGHVGRLVDRLGEAGEIARSEVSPVDGTLPIALLAVGGTLLVLLLADALAGGLRRPAAVGLPLLALWGPSLVLAGDVPWGVFLVTATALLLLLTLDVPGGSRGRRREERPGAQVRRAETSRALVTTAAAVVVALAAGLVGTASAALPGAASGWYRAFTTTGDSIRLSEDLDILSSLTERSGAVVLRYSGPEEDVGPLRSYTASAFDGRRWQRGSDRDGEPFTGSQVLWPDDVPRSGAVQEVDLTVGELRDDKLPLSIDPRSVTADESWGYDPVRDEVVGGLTDEGDTYTLGVHRRDLSAGTLREAAEADIDPAFTDVPDTAHADEIAAMARDVVGDAATPYDQAVALQQWLRNSTRFTYSTTLPRGSTGDPVWDFLQTRTGYCIQFATTMVVMARSLGIPTRIAVGYLPGEQTDEGSWEITGQDSHAWPEIYFPGSGWVRFEPTPAEQTGSAPEYTTPRSDAAQAPIPAQNERRTLAPSQDAAPTADASPSTAAPVTSTPVDDTVPVWVWILTGTLAAALAALLVLLVVRRGKDTTPLDAERAWQEVVSSLVAAGVHLPASTTLRGAPDAIAARVAERTGEPLDRSVLDGLESLAGAAERARYTKHPETVNPDELEALTAAVTAALSERLVRR